MSQQISASDPPPSSSAAPSRPGLLLLVVIAVAAFGVLAVPSILGVVAWLSGKGPVIGLSRLPVLFVLLVSGAVWLVVWAVSANGGRDGAYRVLRERYARGEIGDEDYQRLQATLGTTPAPGHPVAIRIAAGVFLGALAVVILSWITFVVLAVVAPRPAQVRPNCSSRATAPVPAFSQGHGPFGGMRRGFGRPPGICSE